MEWPKEPLDMRRRVGHLCGCTSVDVGPFLTDVLSGATAPTPLARLGVVVGASDADADSIRFDSIPSRLRRLFRRTCISRAVNLTF
jgi:hypothetical protein